MKLIMIFLISFGVLGGIAISQEKEKEENKKIYSEKEFHEALTKEVEIKLKRLKQNEIVDYSKELLKKEYTLKIREKDLNNRKLQISNNENQLEDKMAEFQQQQTKFLSCLTESDKEKDGRIKHMVDALSGMKPDAAAQVLSVQEADIAVRMLGKLDSTKVSKIFNKMDKEVSARLQKQYLTMQK